MMNDYEVIRQHQLKQKLTFLSDNILRIEEAINQGTITYDDVAFYMTDGEIRIEDVESSYSSTDFSNVDSCKLEQDEAKERAMQLLNICSGYAYAGAVHSTTKELRKCYKKAFVNIKMYLFENQENKNPHVINKKKK